MTFPAYPKYEESNVEWFGIKPEGWKTKKLKYVCKINPSKSSSLLSKKSNELVTFLPMENVSVDGDIDVSIKKTVEELWNGFTYFEKNDVIIAKITPCFENGKGACLNNLETYSGFGSTEFHVLRSIVTECVPKYLYYILFSDCLRKIGEVNMVGAAGQKRVPLEFIKEFKIAFPQPYEQQAIADFLDDRTGKIGELIREKEKLLDLLKEKRQTLITRAVTKGLDSSVKLKPSGIDWLGDIPEHWEVKSLKNYTHFVTTGKTPARAEDKYYADNGINWYTPGDFKNKLYLNNSEKQLSELGVSVVKTVPQNTVLMVSIGATIGKVSIAKNVSSFNQQINGISCNSLMIPPFLAYFLKTLRPFITSCGKFTTMPIINQEETKNLFIICPSKEEQKKIADYLNKKTQQIDKLSQTVTEAIERLREYRTVLISAAVTGKIDVRGKQYAS